MSKGYIYLIQTVEAIEKNENVYKFGRTEQENPFYRLRQYKNGYFV